MKIRVTLNELKTIVRKLIEEQSVGSVKFKANHLKEIGPRKSYTLRDNTVFEVTPTNIRMIGEYDTYNYKIDKVDGNVYYSGKITFELLPNKIKVNMLNGKVLEYSVMKVQ